MESDVADDDFNYSDLDWLSRIRGELGLRSDHGSVQGLVDGTIPSVQAFELGLLSEQEAAEVELTQLLSDELQIVIGYCKEKPQSWGGVRLDKDGDVRMIVATFISELEEHANNLARMMLHPERLRVERTPWTRQALLDVQQEISEAQPPGFLGVGVQDKSVVVFLSEGHHHTAASLKDRYGSQVQVIIGDLVGYAL